MRHLIYKAGYWLFHLLVGGYALMLMVGAVAHAQRAPEYQVTELERRVTSLESLNLDHRLTVIETLLQDLQSGSTWNRYAMGGTGLLIAERVVAVMKRRKGESSNG